MTAPFPKGIAYRLSRVQRKVLIEHVPGPLPYQTNQPTSLTVQAMLENGLLKGWPFIRPMQTELTLLGREVVCIVLAEYAEHLMLAGPDYEHRLLPKRKPKCQPEPAAIVSSESLSPET